MLGSNCILQPIGAQVWITRKVYNYVRTYQILPPTYFFPYIYSLLLPTLLVFFLCISVFPSPLSPHPLPLPFSHCPHFLWWDEKTWVLVLELSESSGLGIFSFSFRWIYIYFLYPRLNLNIRWFNFKAPLQNTKLSCLISGCLSVHFLKDLQEYCPLFRRGLLNTQYFYL